VLLVLIVELLNSALEATVTGFPWKSIPWPSAPKISAVPRCF
jgi:hypothetical protein